MQIHIRDLYDVSTAPQTKCVSFTYKQSIHGITVTIFRVHIARSADR